MYCCEGGETEGGLTYPRPSGLVKDLAQIGIDPDGNLFVLFGCYFRHGDTGLQIKGDVDIVSESKGAVELGCGFMGGDVGHGKSWGDTGLADSGRIWRAV
jgi:hypothetical protein